MHSTLIDWQKICDSEDPDRTAVIITPGEVNFLYTEAAGYFDQYGIVETFRYGRISANSYMVIQFKDAIDASNLIRQRYIVVQNIGFIVTPFHSNNELIRAVEQMTFAHPPYYAPPAPHKSEDNILNVLNDDCLSEIFRRTGKLSNLFPIENVCSRFKRVAESAFISEYRKRAFNFRDLNPNEKISLTEIEMFLRRYGSSVVSVYLFEAHYQHIPDGLNAILKLMNEHCPNLKRLSLDFVTDHSKEVESQTLIDIRPLLSKLKFFHIYHKSLSACNSFIVDCDEIEELSVSIYLNLKKIDSIYPEINFPKLKSCHFRGVTDGILEGFLERNPQIEKLGIGRGLGMSLIPEKIPNVRVLKLRGITKISVPDMLRLKCLKEAKISIHSACSAFYEGDSIANICEIANIVELYFSPFVRIDWNVIVGLTRHLCNLETLTMQFYVENQTLSMDHLKEMLQYSKKLTKLLFRAINHQFREQDYNEILQIVKSRNSYPLKVNNDLCTYIYSCPNPGLERKEIVLNTDSRWLTIINRYDNITTTPSREAIVICVSDLHD